MILPPAYKKELPSPEEKKQAEDAWMEYKPIYAGGEFLYWKLYHKKSKKPCSC